MCHPHNVVKSGEGGERWVNALSSTSSITRFAITTETGDPMDLDLNCRKVAFKQSVKRSMISSTLRSVLSFKCMSASFCHHSLMLPKRRNNNCHFFG